METNVMRIERMTQLMEQDKYGEVLEQAEKLAAQDPKTPEIASYVWNQQEVGDADFDLSHMIYDNMFATSGRSPITEIIETKVNILGLSQRLNGNLNSQENNTHNELENSLNFELYRGIEKIEEILPDISNIDSSEEFILNALAQRKYGENYQLSIDYPHHMGGRIAEDLYEHSWEPEYILEDPEAYIDICQKSIKYNLRQNT